MVGGPTLRRRQSGVTIDYNTRQAFPGAVEELEAFEEESAVFRDWYHSLRQHDQEMAVNCLINIALRMENRRLRQELQELRRNQNGHS